MKLPKKYESGQAILIVLLSLAVILTISLYIVSRTVTDISLSGSEEESLRAFSAAEAGIERALVTGSSTGPVPIGDATFNALVSGFGLDQEQIVYPLSLESGEAATFWFVGHNSDGSLGCSDETCFKGKKIKLCWGNSGTEADKDITPAIELSIIYTSTPGDFSTLKIARAAFDPNSSRRSSSSFSAPDAETCTIGDVGFAFQKTINLKSGADNLGISNSTTANVLQFGKVRLFYNTSLTHKVGLEVVEGSALPSQGITVDSTGSFAGANRRIEVFQSHAEAPTIFDSVIFSPTGIVK